MIIRQIFLKKADRVGSMKKYIFLLVFFTHLVIVQAQTVTHTWKGTTGSDVWNLASNWDCSPNPSSVPDGNSIVKIPHISLATAKYPRLTAFSNAKEVRIETVALLDLSTFLIQTTGGQNAKIENHGTLRLEGTIAQKAWFEALNQNNKIVLENGSTVSYYGTSASHIYSGPYKNLNLSRSISTTGLTVENATKIDQLITITSDNQTYKGKVESVTNVTFATTNQSSTIKFEAEVIAKDTGNVFKNITITKGIVETKSVVEAKNISIGANCSNWTSTGNIMVEENISVNDNTDWKANSGNISFKKDLTASKLEQATGKIIANGTGNQNLKVKKIKILEVVQNANLTILSPLPQKIEEINNSGTLNILSGGNINLSKIENNSNAIFNSSVTTFTLTGYLKNIGEFNCDRLVLNPNSNNIIVEGNSPATRTKIKHLSFETAGGKTLKIKNKITVSDELKLKGSSKTSLLTVEGENGTITVPHSLTGEGEFLAVKTNIPIETGTYKTKNSKPEEVVAGDIGAGRPLGWIFNQSLYSPLTWKGGASPTQTDWKNSENWIPRGVPAEETDVVIPSGKAHYPILTSDEKAKTVEVQTGASIDLGAFQIFTTSSAKAKVSNSGELLLSGTNAQRAWFETGNAEHKIVLNENSIVTYNGSSSDKIWIGPYKNLKLSRSINADSLTVNKLTTISSAINVVSNTQTYKGDVDILQNVTFEGSGNIKAEKVAALGKDIIFKCKNVIINGEITANKIEITNTPSNNSFTFENKIEVTTSFTSDAKMLTTKAELIAHDIYVSGTKWQSSGNITAENDILANSIDWEATSGDIKVKHDLRAVKLMQTAGKTILNGNTPQDIKLKKVKELIIITGANAEITNAISEDIEIENMENNGTITIPETSKVKIKKLANKSGATCNINGIVENTETIENDGMITTSSTTPIARLENVTSIINNATAKIEKIKKIKLSSKIKNAGEFSCGNLVLHTTLNNITIEGNSNPSNTNIKYLSFETAGGKILKIKNKITVSDELKLKGSSKTSLLTVEGENGTITVPHSLTGEGEFLAVKTNIPIETGTYKTKNSKPDGSATDIMLGKPENWIFDDPIMPLTWEGTNDSSWVNRENWRPKGLTSEETDTVIPNGKLHYPILIADVKAKSVTIESGSTAEIDLSTFLIKTVSSKLSKISNKGMLKLEGTIAQKAWFEASNQDNKIVLENGSTVSYYGSSSSHIYGGPYKNLKLSRNVSSNGLTVENITNIEQSISITSDNQMYKGNVKAEEDVNFATSNENATIRFEGEVLAKNSGSAIFKNITITKGVVEAKEKILANKLDVSGKSFLSEKGIELEDNFDGKSKKIETKSLVKAKNINIASSSDEWISKEISITENIMQDAKVWKCNGVVQAKNINVGANCTNWISTSNITVEENISVDDSTSWKANSGTISFKKDLTASKLEQATGKIIANGTGNQNIKAKKINEFEIMQNSVSILASLSPLAQIIEKVNNSGTLNIPSNTDLTIAEVNNKAGATFSSVSSIKLKKEVINVGTLTISTLLLIGNAIKIEGRMNQNDTVIDNLLFENASGKSLQIKNNISVPQHLKLSGVDVQHVLEVKGPGKIYLSSSFNDKGKFLHVHTDIPLEGATCITEKSKPYGSATDIMLGKPENWIFDDPIMPLTWEGTNDNSWVNRENWRPKGLTTEETDTVIPNGKLHYPVLIADIKAKSVTIESGSTAEIDLSTFLIKTVSSKLSKISNKGMLKLEGTIAQKAWFEASNQDNKIVLENGSTVSYYGSSSSHIYGGPYKNLKLSRNVSSNGLTVENITNIEQSISITSDNQMYKGNVKAEEDVNFATSNENATIRFEGEVLAKNSGSAIFKNITITKGVVEAKEKILANKLDVSGKSFLSEKGIELEDNFDGKSKKIETKSLVKAKNINIASSSDEWISKEISITENIMQDAKVWKCNGVVQAKNINVGASCTNWISTNNITVEENILALTTQWKAEGGNISVFKDCDSPKLIQSQGALILNGNGEQNLKAKTLNKLEMQNTSLSDKLKLQVETVAEFILQTGNASLLQDMTITKEFANNGGVFDAFENKKIVKLEPINTLKVKGKISITGDPNPPIADTGTKFYQLHCKNAGGKTLHFTNAIEVLYDIGIQPGYIPQPNENFTQDDKSLVLEGGSVSSKLNIEGDGQIWFNKTPPYPKPKKGGKFLHVASAVQIRGGYYRVINGTHDKPAPRNWIFEEYAKIVSTLAINGTDEVCIKFSRAVAKPVPDSLKITSPSFSSMSSISVTSYPKGSNKTNSDKWFFQFGQNFTPEMLLEKRALISLGDSPLDFIFEDEDSDFYPFKKGYISDIGLNLVNPVLAKNTKQIQVFDGTKTLPFINTSLFVDVPAVLDGRTLKLYADSNGSYNNNYWVPNKAGIPWKDSFKATQVENSGAAGFSIDVGKSTADTKMFILPTNIPQLKTNSTVGFMLSYEELPCARLKNQNDIFSFDLWRFDFVGTILQRAGVTILNNVINVSKDQQVGIEITTKGAGTLTVQIMTLDGNIVKTFVNDYKVQGNYSYYWNGRNEAGRAVARGMYFVRISGKGVDEVRKVLVIHD